MKNQTTIKLNKKATLTVDVNCTPMQKMIAAKLPVIQAASYLTAIGGTSRDAENLGWGLRSDIKKIRRSLSNHTKIDVLSQKRPNSVLEAFLRRFDVTTNKKPDATSLGDWIGVEIECFIPYSSLDCDDSTHRAHEKLGEKIKIARIQNVTVKGDGSIRNEENTFPVELCILFKRGNTEALEKLCALLNSLGARVNKSCGLHVHLDARDINSRQATLRGRRLLNALDIFAAMVPKSRRNNQYCALTMNKQKGGSRYAAVNLHAYQKFQTIEMRLHSSTTDFSKIIHWVNILFKTSRAIKLSVKKPASIVDFAQKVGLNDSELSHVLMRTEKFKNEQTEESSGNAA